MLPHIADDPIYRAMFCTEVQLCMQLSNANIVQVFDAGQHGKVLYLAMEWVDGVDLATLLRIIRERNLEIPLPIAGYVIGEILHAIDYAHHLTARSGTRQGIIHRDVSPHNVMISAAGEVKLMDFGVARMLTDETSHEYADGKLRYMPREQLLGRALPASDLFGVGAILHEFLSHQKFRSEHPDDALHTEILTGSIPALNRQDVPIELEHLRLGLLQPDPAERLQNAEDALLVLDRWQGYRNAKSSLRRLYEGLLGSSDPRWRSFLPTVSDERRFTPDTSRISIHAEASTRTYPFVSYRPTEPMMQGPELRADVGGNRTTRYGDDPRKPSHGRTGMIMFLIIAFFAIVLGLTLDRLHTMA